MTSVTKKSIHDKRYHLVAGYLNERSMNTVHDFYDPEMGGTRLEQLGRMLAIFDSKYPVDEEFRKWDKGEQIYQHHINIAAGVFQQPLVIDPVVGKWSRDKVNLRQVEWLMDRKRRIYAEKKISENVFKNEMSQLAVLRRNAIAKERK